MRLLVVTHNYPRFDGDPAGAFVARLARAAARAGVTVRVVAPHAPGTAERSDADGVALTRFRYAPESLERVAYRGDLHAAPVTSALAMLGVPAFLAAFSRAVRGEAKRFAPDVIHAHWWMPGGWLAERSGGAPVVITAHGSDVRLLDRAPFGMVGRRVLARAAAVTTVSRFLADDVRRALDDARIPIQITPMPVDVAHFERGAATSRVSPPRLLYAGNLVPSKGVDVLLRALALLRGRAVSVRLRVLGQGPALDALRALSAELGVADAVEWSPFVGQEAMPAEYGAATVTVLPTRGQAEGLGLTLVEALLAGCAVCGTAAGGIPEVIEDEVTGLIARDGDAEHLAAQLGRLLSDDALRTRLVAEGHARVRERYAEDTAAATFLSIYDAAARRQRAA